MSIASAWGVNKKDYKKYKTNKDRILYFLRYGILAPSMHNTQPWAISVQNDTARIRPKKQRALTHGDKSNIGVYISFGAFIQNCIIAANYHNCVVNVEFLNSLEVRLNFVFGKQNKNRKDKSLIDCINKRRTNRSIYYNKPLHPSLKKEIRDIKEEGIFISILTGMQKDELALIVADSTKLALSDRRFRSELAQYINSPLHKRTVGMPAQSLGFRGAMAYLVPFLFSYINISSFASKKDKELFMFHTPAVVVIATKDNSKYSWIKTGMAYQEIALFATRYNYATHITFSPLHLSSSRRKLKNFVGKSFYPQLIFRIGKPRKTLQHSPRIQVEDLVT